MRSAAAVLRRALLRWQQGPHGDHTRFSEEGDSLVEALIALVVLALAVLALLFGFATSITASGEHRHLATLYLSVRTAADQAISQVQQQKNAAFPVQTRSSRRSPFQAHLRSRAIRSPTGIPRPTCSTCPPARRRPQPPRTPRTCPSKSR